MNSLSVLRMEPLARRRLTGAVEEPLPLPEPVLGGYFSPVEAQLLFSGVSTRLMRYSDIVSQ